MRKFVHGPTLDYAVVKCYPTTALSLFYGEVTFPVRGVVDVKLEGMERARRLAVWRLMSQDGFTVSQVIHFLAGWIIVRSMRLCGSCQHQWKVAAKSHKGMALKM